MKMVAGEIVCRSMEPMLDLFLGLRGMIGANKSPTGNG